MTNKTPVRPVSRERLYDILDGERDYQDIHHPTSPEPTLIDFANLLIEYTDKLAVEVPTPSPNDKVLKRLREIATIAVHAMEIHGVQPRENHVPASAGITGVAKIVAKPDATKPAPKVETDSHVERIAALAKEHADKK